MERRFSVRYDELMAEAEVKPEVLEGVLKRLDEFVKPFAASLKHDAQRQHAAEYIAALVSNVLGVRAHLVNREEELMTKCALTPISPGPSATVSLSPPRRMSRGPAGTDAGIRDTARDVFGALRPPAYPVEHGLLAEGAAEKPLWTELWKLVIYRSPSE